MKELVTIHGNKNYSVEISVRQYLTAKKFVVLPGDFGRCP